MTDPTGARVTLKITERAPFFEPYSSTNYFYLARYSGVAKAGTYNFVVTAKAKAADDAKAKAAATTAARAAAKAKPIVRSAARSGTAIVSSKAKAAANDETELGGHMDKMSGAFRKLKRQIADASKNADSLALVATIKAAGVESAKEKPAWKPQDAAKFQAKMKEFNDKVAKLEAALKAGKNDEAAKIVDELGQAQKEGHKEFKKPDEKKK
jgi:hypothetical protein